MKAQYKQAKKRLWELLDGKNEKAINFVISQFEGLAKAEKDNIQRAGIVDAILGQIKQVPNKSMQTLYFLVEQFRKGEVMQVTDSAYDELQTDLRKRLIFEVQSFFWANNYPFSVSPEDTQFTFNVKRSSLRGDYSYHWLKILVNVNTDSGYLLEIATASKSKIFTDVEECLNFLGQILNQNPS